MVTIDTANHTNGTETAAIAAESARAMRRAVSSLLTSPGKDVRKSIKAIDFNTVWLPFLTAAKASGEFDALTDAQVGAAIRVKIRDGQAKRGKNGRLLFEVDKDVVDTCVLMHRAMVYQALVNPAETFRAANPEGFYAQSAAQERAGKPLIQADQDAVLMDTLSILESAK